VELLVVVGIIVALAGVLIPSIAQFSGRGEVGAQVQEFDAVQSAMDNLMVDIGVTNINPAPGISKNDWASFPNGSGVPPLETYLRDESSSFYYYCWNSSGLITDQQELSGACP
jgi:type II secretory pathway pseudopilin PulG